MAALEPGRTSWTRLLDAVRLGPADDLTAVTVGQVREVVTRLIEAGHWRDGDPGILVIFDAGYEPARLAWLLGDLPAQVLGRLGTSRVLRQPPSAREPGQMGRPVRHGPEFKLPDQATHPAAEVTTSTVTTRYGTATARSWGRLHPKLYARCAWAGHQGELPVIPARRTKQERRRRPRRARLVKRQANLSQPRSCRSPLRRECEPQPNSFARGLYIPGRAQDS